MNQQQKLITIKHKAYKDPFYFISEILGYSDLNKRIHGSLLDFVNKDNDPCLLLEPRGYFKTTTITVGWVIWKIIKNNDIRIVINNKILGNARAFLREIKTHFERNNTFRMLFGDYVGDIWRDDMIMISKRKQNHKEPTISIGAIGHELTSGHYDIIINDDIAGIPDMVSEAAREQTLRFYKSIKYLYDLKGTKEITIGTRWNLFDVYAHIIKTIPESNVRVRKAILDDGSLYFPEMQTLDAIEKEKNDDPILFEAQRQNNPMALSDQLYPLDSLKLYNDYSLNCNYHIGYIDPAFGKNEKGEPCYFCMCILGIVNDNMYVRYWESNKKTPEENEILIINNIIQYNLNRLAIESNAQQSEFIRNVKRGIDDYNKNQIPAKKIFIGIEDINHNTNKDRRIQGMHGTVKDKVFFREDWELSYSESMKQLVFYPGYKFKDAPDALEGAVSMMQNSFNFTSEDKIITEEIER